MKKKFKFKVGQKVRIVKNPKDFHLQPYAGKEVTIDSLPGESHSWMYKIAFPEYNNDWEEYEWENANEEDLESIEAK